EVTMASRRRATASQRRATASQIFYMVAPWIMGLLIATTSAGVSAAETPPEATTVSAPCPTFPGASGFVSRVDNRNFPLIPGTVDIYQGQEDGEKQRTVTTVTYETKTILGVPAVVVLDTLTDSHGGLIEQTLDWYAQDTAGNVWYLGEDTKEYENGQVV